MLADFARGAGDLLDRTGRRAGDMLRSKKGDFVLTIEPGPDRRRGRPDRRRGQGPRDVGPRDPRRAARGARRTGRPPSRSPSSGRHHAPAGIAPFDVRAGDVYCVIDPADPDPATLDAAIRLARLLAIASLRDAASEIDGEAIRAGLAAIRAELDALKGIKATLTSIAKSAVAVQASLDALRDAIVARVADAEAEIRRPAAS